MKLDDLKMELIKLEAEKELTQAWLKKKDEEATEAINKTVEAKKELQKLDKENRKRLDDLKVFEESLNKKEQKLKDFEKELLIKEQNIKESLKEMQFTRVAFDVREKEVNQKMLDVKREISILDKKKQELRDIL